MSVVWKFEIPRPDADSRSRILMPPDAQLLSVGAQGDSLVVWAKHSGTYSYSRPQSLIVVNTGQRANIPGVARFLGTVQVNEVVWHVWDEWPPSSNPSVLQETPANDH